MDLKIRGVIEVARIEGKIFPMMEEAEAHGLELRREWVDKKAGGNEVTEFFAAMKAH